MIDLNHLEELKKKIQKATRKFRFVEAGETIAVAHELVRQDSLSTRHLQDPEDWADVPEPVLWFDNSRKGEAVFNKIIALSAELRCRCNPQKCKCKPTSQVNGDPKIRCRLCDTSLTYNDAAWVETKNYCICGVCKDILYDVLYPEAIASEKINQILEDAVWWARGPRPQLSETLRLLERAEAWSHEASMYPNASK